MAKRFDVTTKGLNSRVDAILDGAAKMRDLILDICPAIIGNAIETGDVRIATKFILGLPNDVFDRPQLVRWFEFHGPFKWEKYTEKDLATGKDVTKYHFTHKPVSHEIEVSYKGDKEAHMRDLAEVTPAFKPVDTEREFDGFDLKTAIHNLVKRAEKVNADPKKAAHEKTDLAGLESLKELDARLSDKGRVNAERGGRGGKRAVPAEGSIPFTE